MSDYSVKLSSNTKGITINDITVAPGSFVGPDGGCVKTPKADKGTWEIKVSLPSEAKNTPDYADSFNKTCGGNDASMAGRHEYAPNDGGPGKSPGELNFWFTVTMTIGNQQFTARSDVSLAMGHHDTTNNWWIGGLESIENVNNKNPTLLARVEDGTFRFAISGGKSDFKFALKTGNAKISLSNWMGALNDSLYLNDLTIPGTHDTCATQSPGLDGAWYKCQKRSLPDQLGDGIRFIDIRCRQIDDEFEIYHDKVDEQISFGTVQSQCVQFLTNNPRETIVMSIKPEGEGTGNGLKFYQVVQNYIAQCPTFWYTGDCLPQLQTVRGKIVLFRRFYYPYPPNQTPLGLEAGSTRAGPWVDNSDFFPISYHCTGGATVNMSVQDQYEPPGVDCPARWKYKWDHDVEPLLDTASSGQPGTLFVNFCSVAGQSALLCKPSDAADYINPKVKAYFSQNVSGRFGCILMDYEDRVINQLIAQTNAVAGASED